MGDGSTSTITHASRNCLKKSALCSLTGSMKPHYIGVRQEHQEASCNSPECSGRYGFSEGPCQAIFELMPSILWPDVNIIQLTADDLTEIPIFWWRES